MADPTPQLPTVTHMLKNLATQAVAVAQDVIHSRPVLATPEVTAYRFNICQVCEFFADPRCTKCGCHMPSKTQISSATCPENFWQ